jgi:hypothetical protein
MTRQSGYTNHAQLIAVLEPGMFVNVRGSGPGGALIRFGTRAPVAHTVVYVPNQPGGYDTVEAEPGGVRRGRLLNYQVETSWPSKRVPNAAQSALMEDFAIKSIGKPYGWIADALIGMHEGLGLSVPDWAYRLKWNATAHTECAQLADLVGIAGRPAGFPPYFDDRRAPGSVSPADLWRLDYP